MAVQANFKDWPLQPKDLHLETFKEEGRGSYGVVHVGEWRGRSVAVKTVHEVFLKATGQNAKLLEKFKEECYKLRGLEHRRVVRLIDTFRDERGRPLLVMEALEESLESYLLGRVGKLAMVRQITIVNELAEGLAYLHENKIVHRDLKPANVLVGKDGCIRIADLGQAKLLENIEMLMQTPQPGTVLFLPPEALRGDGSDSYTFSIDCFSLGVIALCVATQSFPTCGLTEIGTVEEAVRRKNDLDKLPTGHPLETIILGCLQNTQSLRPRGFFIKEHTQALLDKLSLESQLETKSRTVIELRRDLDSEKRRAESLQMEKLLEKEHLESQLEIKNRTVIELRQDLDRQKRCTDRLRNEKQREKLNLMSQLESRNGTVVELRKTLENQKQESAECLRKEKHVFENEISALKEDNAKYVDQVRLLQERRVADRAEFEGRFLTLQTDAKVKIDSCRDNLALNLAGILGLFANFDTNLQPFSDCGPNVASKQSSLPTSDNDRLPQQSCADGKSRQGVKTSLAHLNRSAVGEQMSHKSHQVPVPLTKSHRKLVVSKGIILQAYADIKIVAISSPEGFKVGSNVSLDRALNGLLQQTVNRRYRNSQPDKYDVFTVHCSPNFKVNCRFLVVANIFDHSLGRRSDAPKFLQQILHSVCREADTLEMPTAAIAPGTFDCGGFPKDSILPTFIKMMNEYNFTNDEFLTEVNVFAMSDDDFSVLVQSAERAVGLPLLQTKADRPRTFVSTPNLAHLPLQPSAEGKSSQAAQTRSSLPRQIEPALSDQMSHESCQVLIPLAKNHRKLIGKKGNIFHANADIKIVAISSPEGFEVGNNASLDRALDGLLQQTVNRRHQSSRPDKYDVFTVHCPPNSKVNCRFLVVANILDRSLGRRSDAPKFLQQILHSVCREADTLEMPTAAIAPGTFDYGGGAFDCGGFPKDSILPAFIKMLNEYNFTNDEFLTEVSAFAMSDDDFSVLVQSAERAVGRPQFVRNVVQPPSTEPDVFEISTQSSRRRLVVKKSHFLHEVADIKIVAVCSEDHKHSAVNNPLKGALVQSFTRRYQYEKPRQFDVFTVHCPPEATLQCRFLVVVNMLDRKLGQGVDSHKHLNQILHNVCREADTLEMPTVAIALGTFDIGGFPRESILPAFVRMIGQYNFTNDDFLTDVKFLTANDDRFASMCAVVKHSFGTPGVKLNARSSISPAGSPTHGAHCSSSSYHGRDAPNVQVEVGNIVTFLADAVVVPISSALDLKGCVSEAVNNATHDQLRRKVMKLKIKDGDVVPYKRSMFMTSQWNIKAPHLYLLCRSKNTEIDTLKKGLVSALGEATSQNLKSIAFPIPFLSNKGSKTATADFAKALKDVVTLHQATNPAIVVTVVISKSEASELKDVQETVRNHVVHPIDIIDGNSSYFYRTCL